MANGASDAAGGPGFGPVWRRDRAIEDRGEIDAIIRATNVMHLALADGNRPLVVPLFFAYDGRALYFHSALAGTKMDILERNQEVCFEISVDHGVVESELACDFEARHRTVIGFGKAALVEDEAEKTAALDLIVAGFTGRRFVYPKERLRRTAVVRIDIESVTGKKFGV